MSSHQQIPNRLELYKAGKLEERRSVRPPHVPEKIEIPIEENIEGFKLRPEIVAIGLLVLVLIVLTLIGM